MTGVLAAGTAAGQTFQTGDTINLNATSDININITGDFANTVDINNARSVNFRNLTGVATNAANTNAILWDGVGTFGSNQSLGAVGLINGSAATTYSVSNSIAGQADGLTIGLRAADVAGANTTINFSATNAGTGGANPTRSVLTSTSAGVETLAVNTTGANFLQVATANGNGTTDYATLNLTGVGGDITLAAANTLAATSTINGSTLTGNLALNVGGGLSTGDTVRAGAGTLDVLTAATAGTVATGLNISGFEVFSLDSGANSTLTFTAAPNFNTVRLNAGAAGVKTLANVGSFNTLQFVGTGTAATAGNQNTFNGVTTSGGFAGGADTVAVAVSNGGVTNTNATPYALGPVNLAGVENINLTVADNTANTLVTLPSVVSSTLQAFNATGSVNLAAAAAAGNPVVIDTQTANSNSIATVNLGGLSGAGVSQIALGTAGAGNTANILGPVTNVTASTGGTTLTVNQVEVATDVLNFTGGNGVDTFTAVTYAGNVIGNGGASADTFTIGDGNGAAPNGAASTNLTGGAAGDTFTLSNGRTALNVITDLGLGAAVNPAAGQETLTIIGAATGVTATVVANFIDQGAAVAGDTAIIDIASAAANNVFNLNAGVVFNAAGNAGAGGVTVNANAAGSFITGTGAADALNGGVGNDILVGGAGNDVIVSGGGTDAITGGTNNDAITAGAGQQTFIQATGDSTARNGGTVTAGANAIAAGQTLVFGNGVDVITNFAAGAGGDILDLATGGPAQLLLGTNANALVAGTNYILSGNFNTANGTFTIAANGAGADSIIYQGFAAAGTEITTNTSGIVLVGVNSANFAAANII